MQHSAVAVITETDNVTRTTNYSEDTTNRPFASNDAIRAAVTAITTGPPADDPITTPASIDQHRRVPDDGGNRGITTTATGTGRATHTGNEISTADPDDDKAVATTTTTAQGSAVKSSVLHPAVSYSEAPTAIAIEPITITEGTTTTPTTAGTIDRYPTIPPADTYNGGGAATSMHPIDDDSKI